MNLKSFKNNSKNNLGFTVVELLVVVTVIGLVSAITLSAVNIDRQKDLASEAARVSNLKKTAEAIEAYKVLEKEYPEDCSPDTPLECNPALSTIMNVWPDGLEYATDGDEFVLYSASPVLEGTYFKYSSSWKSETSESAVRKCGEFAIDDPTAECFDPGMDDTVTLSSILVTLENDSIEVGSSTKVTAKAVYSNDYQKDISTKEETEWSSSKTSIASVNKSPTSVTVTGNGAGSSVIEARYQGKKGQDTINVVVPPPPSTFVVSASASEVDVGSAVNMTATNNDANVTYASTWTSSNNEILRIEKNFLGTKAVGVSPGTATVSATYLGNSDSVPITVNSVDEPPTEPPTEPPADKVLTSVTLSPTNKTLQVGQTFQFVAYANYDDGSKVDITSSANWSLTQSGSSVSLGDLPGQVYANSFGYATLKATYTEGSVSKTGSAVVIVQFSYTWP